MLHGINYTSGHKLNRSLFEQLATCEYITEHRNLFWLFRDLLSHLFRLWEPPFRTYRVSQKLWFCYYQITCWSATCKAGQLPTIAASALTSSAPASPEQTKSKWFCAIGIMDLTLPDCRIRCTVIIIFITGATGIGKTYLACAFGMEACKKRYKTKYVRLPKLFLELEMARNDGT